MEIFQVCAVQHLAQLRKEGVVQFPPTETALMILLRRCGPGPWGLSEVQNVLQGILQIHRYPQLSTVWFHKRVGFTLAENKLGVCEDIGWGCFEPAFTLIFCRGPIISNHLNQWDKGLLAESQEHFLAKPNLGLRSIRQQMLIIPGFRKNALCFVRLRNRRGEVRYRSGTGHCGISGWI